MIKNTLWKEFMTLSLCVMSGTGQNHVVKDGGIIIFHGVRKEREMSDDVNTYLLYKISMHVNVISLKILKSFT